MASVIKVAAYPWRWRRNDNAQDNLRLDRRRPRAGVRASTSVCADPTAGGRLRGPHPKDGGGRGGSNAARTRHRNTLNRQRARAAAEHARHVRAPPNR